MRVGNGSKNISIAIEVNAMIPREIKVVLLRKGSSGGYDGRMRRKTSTRGVPMHYNRNCSEGFSSRMLDRHECVCAMTGNEKSDQDTT